MSSIKVHMYVHTQYNLCVIGSYWGLRVRLYSRHTRNSDCSLSHHHQATKGLPQHKPLIFEHQMVFALSTYPTSTFFVLSFSIIASTHTYLRSTSISCFAYLLFSTVSPFISIVALPNISWSWCSFSENLFNPSFKTGFTPVENLHVSELFVRLKVSIQLKNYSKEDLLWWNI